MSSRSSSPEIEGAVGGESVDSDIKMNSDNFNAGMEAFFQKNRSDVMYELRQLEHGDRPVTGQGHRDQIHQFLSKRLEVQVQNEGKENVPANVDRVEEHRPEAIVVEVEGLYQQRPVSSLLGSSAFRHHLNNIIRQSMSSFSVTPRSSVSPPGSHLSSPRPSRTSPSPEGHHGPQRSASRATATPASAAAESGVPVRGGTPRSTPAPSRLGSPAQQQVSTVSPHAELLPDNSSNVGAVPRSAVNDDQPVLPVVGHAVLENEEVVHRHREDMVDEISELVHRQLVTSALEGDFRGTLELHVEERLGRSASDGERVRNFLRTLPVDPLHRRNDFSHLGIQLDNDVDNISVTSISAAAVPYTQTNLHMSRELHALKAQMEEMKNMLKLSMEMQLDTQRAIRQEVAAAIAQASGGQAESISRPSHTTPPSDSHCLICLESYADSVLYQCGHLCLCYRCGKHLMAQEAKCPLCRAPIRDIVRVYKSNVD